MGPEKPPKVQASGGAAALEEDLHDSASALQPGLCDAALRELPLGTPTIVEWRYKGDTGKATQRWIGTRRATNKIHYFAHAVSQAHSTFSRFRDRSRLAYEKECSWPPESHVIVFSMRKYDESTGSIEAAEPVPPSTSVKERKKSSRKKQQQKASLRPSAMPISDVASPTEGDGMLQKLAEGHTVGAVLPDEQPTQNGSAHHMTGTAGQQAPCSVTGAVQPSPHDEDDTHEDLDELVGWWTGDNMPLEMRTLMSGFQRGHGSLPPVPQLTGSEVLALLARPVQTSIPALAKQGLVHTTRLEHQRMLKTLEALDADLLQAPITTAVIEHLTRRSNARRWRATTLLKYLCSAQGALAALPLYRHAPSVNLQQCVIWRQAIRGATIRAKQELPNQPEPATWPMIQQALKEEPSLPIRAAIIIMWMTCARGGCVLQLHSVDVVVHQDASMSVRFRKGKGARVRGPYTVHTASLPPMYLAMIKKWLAERSNKQLFPMLEGADIKTSLRRANRLLEQRSIRRGALMTLSLSPGITDSLLMEFSGHTQQATLRRYLNWGKTAAHLRTTMKQAADGFITNPTLKFG